MPTYKSSLRLNVKVAHDDAKNVIDIVPSLPTGIKMVNQAALKRSHRFIFTFTSYRLIPKLFTAMHKKVKHNYTFIPKISKKL